MVESEQRVNHDLSLGAQIRCIERELAMCRTSFAKRVDQGSMAKITADREIALRIAILDTLCECTHRRAEVRKQLERIIGTLNHATHTVDVLHAQSIATDLLESLKGES